MTEKELRDDIIVKMLDYRDKENVPIDRFCSVKKITFTSDKQKMRAFKRLNDFGYINLPFFPNLSDSFTITSYGVDYAKRLINKTKKGKAIVSINGENPVKKKIKYSTSSSYTAKENYIEIIDNNVEACFDVEYLAECYVKLIDTACGHRENNVCLVGIFAPWGRGKSYFFKKTKEYINERKRADAIQYDIVEFNAWKYQETPAIWAYLFETLYNSKDRWFKFRYAIKRIWNSISCGVLLLILIVLLYNKNILDLIYDNARISLAIIVSILSAIGFILDFISKHCYSAISLIKKYSKGVSFANELGVQAEIEKEITSLLKFWIKEEETNNRKVILYIDDIDRCSETKMTSIIDSLRTVLENEEIRKRLIIICSIDPEKVIKGIEYKYETIYNDKEERRSIAIDQMDKIFLTGIALAPLGNEQLFEFALKLTGADNKNSDGQLSLTADNQNIKKNSSILNHNNDENEKCVELSYGQIYLELKKLIKNNNKQLTPRKIRIIYYRILLANNIICNKEDSNITGTLIKDIFNLSVGEKIDNDEINNELLDILNMVVPYKYKEEEKNEEKNQ